MRQNVVNNFALESFVEVEAFSKAFVQGLAEHRER